MEFKNLLLLHHWINWHKAPMSEEDSSFFQMSYFQGEIVVKKSAYLIESIQDGLDRYIADSSHGLQFFFNFKIHMG